MDGRGEFAEPTNSPLAARAPTAQAGTAFDASGSRDVFLSVPNEGITPSGSILIVT